MTTMSHSPSRTEIGVLGNGAFFETRGTYFTQAVHAGSMVGGACQRGARKNSEEVDRRNSAPK